MPSRAHRVDTVQLELFADLRRFGFSVADISIVGNDIPDAVIGRQGVTALLEVKTPYGLNGDYRITEGQQEFARQWRGNEIIYGHKAEEVARRFKTLCRRLGKWP